MEEWENLRFFLSRVALSDAGIFISILLVAFLLVRLLKEIGQLIQEKIPNQRMIFLGWIPFITFSIYLGGLGVALYFSLSPSREMFLGVVATLLLAFGIGMKDILKSIVSGVVLLLDRPFQVGDHIILGKEKIEGEGEVISMDLYSIKLKKVDESIITVANSVVLEKIITSVSAGQLTMIVSIEMFFPKDINLAYVCSVLEKVALEDPLLDNKKEVMSFARECSGDTISVTLECRIKEARTEKQFQTRFLERAQKALTLVPLKSGIALSKKRTENKGPRKRASLS